MTRLTGRGAVWIVLGLVLAGALFVGSRSDGGRPTDGERAARIAAGVRCPTCRGLSVAESDARASVAVRDEIRRRVDRGESDAEIRAYLVGRYGEDILLSPPSNGLGAVAWALPVVVVVLGAAGLAARFRHWERQRRVSAA